MSGGRHSTICFILNMKSNTRHPQQVRAQTLINKRLEDVLKFVALIKSLGCILKSNNTSTNACKCNYKYIRVYIKISI